MLLAEIRRQFETNFFGLVALIPWLVRGGFADAAAQLRPLAPRAALNAASKSLGPWTGAG